MSLRDVLDALAERTKGHGGEGFLSLSMHSPSITPERVERLCRAYIEARGWGWETGTNSQPSKPYSAMIAGPVSQAWKVYNADTPAEALGQALLAALKGGGG